MQLQQRTWLMHWALHVFWNTEAGKTALIDLFLQPAYMSAIQVGVRVLMVGPIEVCYQSSSRCGTQGKQQL
jgi:hypothetical protein